MHFLLLALKNKICEKKKSIGEKSIGDGPAKIPFMLNKIWFLQDCPLCFL